MREHESRAPADDELHSALTTQDGHIDLAAEGEWMAGFARRAVIAVLGILLALLIAVIGWQAVAAQLRSLEVFDGVARHG